MAVQLTTPACFAGQHVRCDFFVDVNPGAPWPCQCTCHRPEVVDRVRRHYADRALLEDAERRVGLGSALTSEQPPDPDPAAA